MKKILYVIIAVVLIAATSPGNAPADTSLKGAWRLVRYQYGKEPMKNQTSTKVGYKMFTGSRWSGSEYDKNTKEITGSCGGTYKLKGNQYEETIEYYSWDNKVSGKTYQFNMTMENGMLHQKGTMEWDGDPHYAIEEWYERVD